MNGPGGSFRPRILGLLPRGEAIRNFAYSGALEELATGSDVSLASVIPTKELRTLLESKFGPVLELDDHVQPWRAGKEVDFVELPASWHLDDVPPVTFVKAFPNSHAPALPRRSPRRSGK